MVLQYRFIEPLDVLYLRGNRLFEGAGAHGAALMPPWPSLAAGALRSRMLADNGVDFARFAAGEPIRDARLANCLGTPDDPGFFRIALFALARRTGDGIEPCFPLPADLTVIQEENTEECLYLRPLSLPGVNSSYPLSGLPVLRTRLTGKPVSGLWLNAKGLSAYLAGQPLGEDHLLRNSQLWQTDPRLGIALDEARRSAVEGILYTAETVALCPDTGFLVGVADADGILPDTGLLRLGGDGRGSVVSSCHPPLIEPDWQRIAQENRFRLVLATPGLFPEGWRLPGLDSDRWRGPKGISARLTAACVSRAETVSGWNLAAKNGNGQPLPAGAPKPAQRVAPVGSVYFFEDFSGDITGLRRLLAEGLWPLIEQPDAGRRAEGFNNIWIAAWPR